MGRRHYSASMIIDGPLYDALRLIRENHDYKAAFKRLKECVEEVEMIENRYWMIIDW